MDLSDHILRAIVVDDCCGVYVLQITAASARKLMLWWLLDIVDASTAAQQYDAADRPLIAGVIRQENNRCQVLNLEFLMMF